jgi:hypothetical protein
LISFANFADSLREKYTSFNHKILGALFQSKKEYLLPLAEVEVLPMCLFQRQAQVAARPNF